jgi:membrane protein
VSWADVRRALTAPPGVRRHAGWAAFGSGLRFVRRGGGYHAAALTYYSILSVFPAGALALGLLGLIGAESAITDAGDALESRSVKPEFVDAVQKTIRSAVEQRQGHATIAVVISIGASIYVASRWVRGVARGLDAVLDRPPAASALRFLGQLRDTIVLVVLFVGALVLAFVGGGLASGWFGEALSWLWQVAAYLLAALAGAGAYAYIYAFVPAPPRAPPDALLAGALVGMLLWILATAGFDIFAHMWPGYDTNYGVFATLIVAIVWLWLTNASVLLGAAFAAEWVGAGESED